MHGMRVHSWVLVCPGARDVPEAFFIGTKLAPGLGQRR
jgi:hypothetical protein